MFLCWASPRAVPPPRADREVTRRRRRRDLPVTEPRRRKSNDGSYPCTRIARLAGGALLIVLAGGILRGSRLTWHGAALLAALTFISFIAVRTVGLPNFYLTDWVVMVGVLPLGPLSLAADLSSWPRMRMSREVDSRPREDSQESVADPNRDPLTAGLTNRRFDAGRHRADTSTAAALRRHICR